MASSAGAGPGHGRGPPLSTPSAPTEAIPGPGGGAAGPGGGGAPGAAGATGSGPPQTPVLSVSCRMLRSPSHESVTTDLSLFSVSSMSLAADMRSLRLVGFNKMRGPSPNPDSNPAITR